MYQFPITARRHARKRPSGNRIRVAPSTVPATREYWTGRWGDVNGVV